MAAIRSKLSIDVQRELIAKFVKSIPANVAAKEMQIEQNTATLYYNKIRLRIHTELEEFAFSEFNNRHVIDIRIVDRSFTNKAPIMGIWKQDGRIMARTITSFKTDTDAFMNAKKSFQNL